MRPAEESNNPDQPSTDGGAASGFPIDYVADLLSMRGAKPLVVVVSPAGDSGSTATVMLARAMSENGRSVVLVDMTASGTPSRLMMAQDGLPGILDLLMGDAAFGETIHHDRLSSAHVVPQGVIANLRPGPIMERLTMVLGALSGTYETVLIEFGAAPIASLSRVLRHLDADVVLSLSRDDAAMMQEALQSLDEAGNGDVIPMISGANLR